MKRALVISALVLLPSVSGAQAPTPPATPPSRPSSLPQLLLADQTRVTLESSNRHVELWSRGPAAAPEEAAGPERKVCSIPCNQIVSTSDTYYIAGHNMMASQPFSLANRNPAVTVRVSAFSPNLRIAGWVMAGNSTWLLGLGILGVAIGSDPAFKGTVNPFTVAGSVGLSVGAGLLLSGIIIVAAGRTRVHLHSPWQEQDP